MGAETRATDVVEVSQLATPWALAATARGLAFAAVPSRSAPVGYRRRFLDRGGGVTSWRRAVPIIPARDVSASADFYRDQLGFTVVHTEREYGVLRRGPVEIHLWGPSGIAPEASDTMLRIEVDGLEALHADCERRGLVHENAPPHDEPWGTREFAIRDVDGHLITFFTPHA